MYSQHVYHYCPLLLRPFDSNWSFSPVAADMVCLHDGPGLGSISGAKLADHQSSSTLSLHSAKDAYSMACCRRIRLVSTIALSV